MRSEAEVRAMIEELKAVRADNIRRNNRAGEQAAGLVIAALANVLDGPTPWGPCGCMGPDGCCLCLVASLEGKQLPAYSTIDNRPGAG